MTGDAMSDEVPRTFEQALGELEDHVRRLDAGELALDDSLAVFESGVKLVRECQELLDGADQRITELTAASASATAPSDAGSGG
jgi:exodeoxyribonuclease VII small subunit